MHALVVALLLTSVGCASVGPGKSTGLVLNHDGLRRTYQLYVPRNYSSDAATPLVFVLHGGFGSGSQAEKAYGFDAIADRENFLVAYPDGVGFIKSWNAGHCCGPAQKTDADDVGFLVSLVDEIAKDLNVDRNRVYATGMSNGAMLSHRLACERADVFAAVATVSGSLEIDTCRPSRPIPILSIYGGQDKHVPLDGKRECGVAKEDPRSGSDSTKMWREANACSGDKRIISDENSVRCESQGTCGADTVQCVVDGGGHDWPGGQATPRFVTGTCTSDGAQNRDWQASEKIWEFFKAHPR